MKDINQDKNIILDQTMKKEWEQPQITQLNVKDTKGGAALDLVELPFISHVSS